MPPAGIVEGFRRMVFNIMAFNQEDHVKNLSFHMDRTGTWSLTPAYDLTYAKGGGVRPRPGRPRGYASGDPPGARGTPRLTVAATALAAAGAVGESRRRRPPPLSSRWAAGPVS